MEEQEISNRQKRLYGIVSSEGWEDVRKVFTDRVLGLQNVFSMDASDPHKLLFNVEVNKKVASELFEILREIEGTAQQKETETPNNRSHILMN